MDVFKKRHLHFNRWWLYKLWGLLPKTEPFKRGNKPQKAKKDRQRVKRLSKESWFPNQAMNLVFFPRLLCPAAHLGEANQTQLEAKAGAVRNGEMMEQLPEPAQFRLSECTCSFKYLFLESNSSAELKFQTVPIQEERRIPTRVFLQVRQLFWSIIGRMRGGERPTNSHWLIFHSSGLCVQ